MARITLWAWSCGLCLVLFRFNQSVMGNYIFEFQQLYEGSRCNLANGAGEGICVKAESCPERIRQISTRTYTTINRCGFQNFTEIFCCEMSQEQKEQSQENPQLKPAEAACQGYMKILADITDDGGGTVHISVFNGVRAREKEFPFMAALGYTASEEEAPGGIKYICGGSLISKKHVLTAAHCVSNIHGFVPVEVLLGATDIDDPNTETMQRIPISRILKHPEHKQSLKYHDVAILELKDLIKFTAYVYPTCLTTKMNEDEYTSFTILGWGAVSLDGTTSTKLLKAEFLNAISNNECSESYKNVRAQIPNGIDDGMICVTDPDKTRNADTCWGDSGGPLLIPSGKFPLLTGVTSFGQACGGSAPGVYASVYKYLDWIEHQVWPNVASYDFDLRTQTCN